ncbi:type II toxin-antitoxin system HicB family antitoxin [Hoeflea sp.]|uniref:type II toxin-antitoxin system HicB family antitoxin n=1 Tax=Hoeflea sp. TaxID=1940281 RepID=UPI0031B878BC
MERNSRQIIRRLEKDGFELVKVRGSHHKFRKGGKTVTVPHPKKNCRSERSEPSPSRLGGLTDKEHFMRHYIGVVHQDGDSAFGVHFPDVPGCFSAADQLDDLLAHASEALALHLEGEALPDARSLEAVREDADVARDLMEGAFLLAVPVIRLSGRTTKANITMDAGLLAAVDATARSRGLTRSAFLADLARREITG